MDGEAFLVKRARDGDGEAFRQLVETYQGYVFAVILTLVREQDQAENIAQEVFLQCYRSLAQYQGGSFRAWLGKIATNKAIDFRRAQGRLAQETAVDDFDQIVSRTADRSTPETQLLAKEDQKKVKRVCSGLPDIYRRVIEEFYLEEKSYGQIAGEEGVSLKTVESRLYRARILFRQKWGEGV